MPDFIPRADEQCLAWSTNYVRVIEADQERFGASTADAAAPQLASSAGTKVWICAQWSNPRGEAGPGSDPKYAYLGYPNPQLSAAA